MDKNYQYGQVMTKPLPYGCITEFNKILDKMSHEDNIGHLFIVDIKFHNINLRTIFFNEIYPPIFEKKWKLS